MKDKQIQYLLTLKRKFESIRHDQYQFSEKNPVESAPSELPLSKLYQMINYSLQSIEFKKTVNQSYKKPKKEQNKTQQGENQSGDNKYYDNQLRQNNENIIEQPKDDKKFKMVLRNSLKKENYSCSQSKIIPNKSKKLSSMDSSTSHLKQKEINNFNKKYDQTSNLQDQTERTYQSRCLESNLDSKNMLKEIAIKKENQDLLENKAIQLIKVENQEVKELQQNGKVDQNFDYNKEGQYNPYVKSQDFQIQNYVESIDIMQSQRQIIYTPQKVLLEQQNCCNIVEIKQLFTDEKEEKLQMSEIFSNITIQNKIQYSTKKSFRKYTSEFIFIDNSDESQNQNEQPNIDQYFNFETPQKNNYLEENDLQEKQAAQNTANKISFSLLDSRLKELEDMMINNQKNSVLNINQNYVNTQLKDQQPNFTQTTIKEGENDLKTTVKKIITVRNVSNNDNSDQTVKYRFSQTDTSSKKESVQQLQSSELQESAINQKQLQQNDILTSQNITSRTKIVVQNPKITNKKIAKKLEFKQNEELRQYIRGPYNFYSEELKKKAIKDYYKYKDIKVAAKLNEVKAKNLKRWITVGHKRKEGGGRKKEDPEMEEQVYQWLKEQYYQEKKHVTRNQIREKALKLSNKKDKFKASKGWLEKFFTRYNCKFMSKKDAQQLSGFQDDEDNNNNNDYQQEDSDYYQCNDQGESEEDQILLQYE